MRLRKRNTPPEGGPNYFGVRTRIARSTGTDKRYKLSAIRALPTRKKDTVVLQATDGQQAVCLITLGQMSSPRLVPSKVLPTRKDAKGITVDLSGDQWRSSDGKITSDEYADDSSFPQIADVLPDLNTRNKPSHIQLGIDLALLSKVADSLGTCKLTLFIPVPDKTREPDTASNGYVKKPVAVCPATDEGKVRGVGVVMPLQPTNGVPFYEKVRRLVASAETRCQPVRANTTRAPQPV